MSGVLRTILIAALGINFAVPLYAADAQTSSAADKQRCVDAAKEHFGRM